MNTATTLTQQTLKMKASRGQVNNKIIDLYILFYFILRSKLIYIISLMRLYTNNIILSQVSSIFPVLEKLQLMNRDDQ